MRLGTRHARALAPAAKAVPQCTLARVCGCCSLPLCACCPSPCLRTGAWKESGARACPSVCLFVPPPRSPSKSCLPCLLSEHSPARCFPFPSLPVAIEAPASVRLPFQARSTPPPLPPQPQPNRALSASGAVPPPLPSVLFERGTHPLFLAAASYQSERATVLWSSK